MAINQNHLFEELNGVKCAIVEKNASPERVDFLKKILEYNGFTVVVAASPPPKVVPAQAVPPPARPVTQPAATEGAPLQAAPMETAPPPQGAATQEAATEAASLQPPAQAAPTKAAPMEAGPPPQPPSPPPVPATFTVGVTDVSFNPINAIFGRLLKTPGGHVVTLAYWQQKDDKSHDEVPYFETGHGK
jgi:hypothetical protein